MDDLELIKVVNEKIKLNENIDENLKALINLNNLQELFIRSCRNGYKETAMWLYELSKTDGNKKININAWDDSAFRLSCRNGYKETALWLYELSKTDGNIKININAENYCAFRWSCYYGHQETALWLYELSKNDGNTKININADTDYAFRYSCSNGHKETAKWLYELSKTDGNKKINIHAEAEFAFRYGCENGHKEPTMWLCSLYSKYKFTINENNQIVYIIITDNNDDIDKYAFEYNIQMLLLKDGYLKINNNNNEAHNERERFYQIIEKLPLDLTQKMSYILCGSTKTIIKSSTFNRLLNHKN